MLQIILTHWLTERFVKNALFWHFGGFEGWISAKLALIWSKRHLQHTCSLPFFATSILFYDIWARVCAEIKILREKVT